MKNVLKKMIPKSIQLLIKKTFPFLSRSKVKLIKRSIFIFIINIFISLTKKLHWEGIRLINNKLIGLREAVSFNLFDDHAFLTYVKRKKEGFAKYSSSIKTLVLRGSNADFGFYSPAWEGSYNLGLISSDLYTDYHLYINNKDKLDNLEKVIVFISVGSIGFSLIKTKERYRAVSYKYFFKIPYQDNECINSFFEKQIFKKCKKINFQEIDSNYRGYEKKNNYATNVLPQERVKSHLRENRRQPDQLNWLKLLHEVIISDGRKLIIIMPPVRADYRNLLPPDSILFKKLYELNLKEVKIINFYTSELFSDEDFGDTDHLNERGAIKLTNEIYRIFKKNGFME